MPRTYVKRKKHRSRRGRKKGRRLRDSEKMMIVTLRDLGHTYNEIAAKVGCCFQTVETTLKTWAPQNDDLVKKARAQACLLAAQDVGEKAKLALQHITPDSLTHDRVEVRDPETGRLMEVKHSGPTGFHNANTFNVLAERVSKLQDRAADILNAKEGTPLGADDVASVVASIMSRAKKLEVHIDLPEAGQVYADADVVGTNDGDAEDQ